MYSTYNTYIHTCILKYIHTYILTYIHTYIHAYMHTCMHACMHAYIRKGDPWVPSLTKQNLNRTPKYKVIALKKIKRTF